MKRLGTINLKQYKYPKALFFNVFFQFEKIWKNREKRQLHSQLHSNYIQKMSVTTLPARAFASFISIASYLLSNNISDIYDGAYLEKVLLFIHA
ncbi:MAG: hypothetical protein IKP72_06775 [Clostridia bacterium]|nr:hypothetical protein [Clostridia bacterium]